MSLRDEILRHQLLLMRLIRTQANKTRKQLILAQKRIIKAIQDDSYARLRTDVKSILSKIPAIAKPLLNDLAIYEADFTAKKIKKYKKESKTITNTEAVNKVDTMKVSASLKRPAASIQKTYKQFADAKLEQYMQVVKDSKVLKQDKSETIALVRERTNGLFTTQNEVLAGVAVVGVANLIRAEIIKRNSMLVDWVLDLELNNCPDCEEYADNSPYNPDDVDGLIPLHGRCGCTLVPIDDN